MKGFVNRAIRFLAGSVVGLITYRLASFCKEIAIRFGSVAKQRALFPHAVNLRLDVRTEIKYPENIRIGRDVIIGADCRIGAMAPVEIGDHVRLSRGVTLETAGLAIEGDPPYTHVAKPIVIGRGVWLGAGVTVLGGVSIGELAVIGAGTVVSKNVEAGARVVGSAVRVIPARSK